MLTTGAQFSWNILYGKYKNAHNTDKIVFIIILSLK